MKQLAMEAIEKINEIEAAAQGRQQEAVATAKQQINEAKRLGRLVIDEANQKAEADVQKMLEKAEHAAADTQMKTMAQAESECEKLRILARGRMKRAVEHIVERVEGESCQS